MVNDRIVLICKIFKNVYARLTSHLYSRGSPPYVINLDPACRDVPYPANIDIRDTVNYKQGTEGRC